MIIEFICCVIFIILIVMITFQTIICFKDKCYFLGIISLIILLLHLCVILSPTNFKGEVKMNAKKCDRCGKFIDINEDYIGISIKHFSQGWESLPEDLDFCENCAKELFKRGDKI